MTSFDCPDCDDICYNVGVEDEDMYTVDGADFICENCGCEFTVSQKEEGANIEMHVTKHGFKVGGE